MGKFIIVFVGNFAVTERIEIANLIIFVVKRSNMKRMSFLSVPYQAIIWPAILMALGQMMEWKRTISLPTKCTSAGQNFSKSW